ncbi:hypothetical protein Rumi2_08820 [[Ruminococcus] torques]|nr:hypothetical protein Rumi1_19240 [[Ruminococcus] torques]BEI77722.1 hypothetical protein Rumi2_08820 [[Ruminococcus] torques]
MKSEANVIDKTRTVTPMSIINFTSAVKNKQRYSNTKVWNKKHNAHSNRDNRTSYHI